MEKQDTYLKRYRLGYVGHFIEVFEGLSRGF